MNAQKRPGCLRWILLLAAFPSLIAAALPAAAEDATASCQVLTPLNAEDLMQFQFESDPVDREKLPGGSRFTLGEIRVVRQRVFEEENNWLHRVTNRYHPLTREDVILAVLPFRSGASVNLRALAEAERILRSKAYLYDARVIPYRRCGDVLDIYVVTRDVWSLEPRLSFDRAGGENSYALGVGDSNIMGSGRASYFSYFSNEDRDGFAVSYADPNLRKTRWGLNLLAADSSDGSRYAASIRRPFFALDTRRAMNLAGDRYRRKEGLYFLSNKLWEYDADSRVGDFSVGASPGIRDGRVNRFRLGLGYEQYQFDYPVALLARVDPQDAEDRKLVYPYVSYQRIRDSYDKRLNLDRVYRTEDIALGSVLGAQLGWSADRFGGEGDKLVGRFSYQDSLWLASDQLLTYDLSLSGYYDLDRDRSEDVLAQAILSYRYRHADAFGLLLRAAVAAAHNPPLDKPLVLGGDTGLRGYPTRYQVGDSWFLVTVEERYYSDVYPFRMFRLGAAVFADFGRAWYRNDAPGWVPPDRTASYFDTLANVGVGLRLESTRTRRDRLLHIDLSLPLRDGPDTQNLEFTVTVKQSL